MTPTGEGPPAPAGGGRDSIAGVLLGRGAGARAARAAARRVREAVPAPGSVAAEILGPAAAAPRELRTWIGAGLSATALHALALALALQLGPGPPPATEREAVLQLEHVVELAPPPPPPAPAPSPRAAPPRPPAAAPARAAEEGAPPPAQAGQIVAAEGPADPVDLTGFEIVTGAGTLFAGGVTASTGTSTHAVHARVVDPNARQGSRAQAVHLPTRNWTCPWPREADALGIDEQEVLLRVVVDGAGRVTSADLLADPGHGFGAAALACARKARFEPARDRDGEPFAATSPPIRVRFTRS